MHALAVDEAFVYWAESATDGLRVRKAPKGGAGPVTDLGGWSGDLTLRLIVTDGTSIYWLNGSAITRQPKDGSPPTTLPLGRTPGPGGMDGPVLDGNQLYLVDRGCSAFGRVPVDGSPPAFTDVPTTGNYGGSTAMAVDATRVYCANGPNIVAQPKAGGAVVAVVTGQELVGGVLSDDRDLYWVDNHTVPRDQALWVLRGGSSTPTMVGAVGFGNVGLLRLDAAGDSVYWATGATLRANIGRYIRASGAIDFPVSGVTTTGAIDQDSAYVYWGSDKGIMRLRK